MAMQLTPLDVELCGFEPESKALIKIQIKLNFNPIF